jgi:predicted Zn-dependent protease
MNSCLAVALAISLALPFSAIAKDKKKAKNDVERIGDRDVDGKVNLYSIEKEIQMGKQFADEIERQAKIIDDPVVAEYVNRVGQNLARHSDSQIPFYFKVIADPQINAFALPGGFCFVNTGLILEAETEAEMAGVLAHEIAHVAARHGTRQATRGQIANLATIPLMIMTGGWGGYAVSQVAGLALPIAFMQFSREFEREADHLGIQYLYAAGYDPTSFVDFFEKLASQQKTKPGAFASVFSSHPMTDDRIEAAQVNMDEILPTKPEYLVNTSEFEKVKQRVALLMNPESRKSRLPDAPQVRRDRQVTVITKDEPKAEQEAEDEDTPPVLRRKN